VRVGFTPPCSASCPRCGGRLRLVALIDQASVIREPSADWFDILFDASSLLTKGSQISRKAASALIDRLNVMSPQNGNRNADHQHRYRKQN
jgi:hypothetical protein